MYVLCEVAALCGCGGFGCGVVFCCLVGWVILCVCFGLVVFFFWQGVSDLILTACSCHGYWVANFSIDLWEVRVWGYRDCKDP